MRNKTQTVSRGPKKPTRNGPHWLGRSWGWWMTASFSVWGRFSRAWAAQIDRNCPNWDTRRSQRVAGRVGTVQGLDGFVGRRFGWFWVLFLYELGGHLCITGGSFQAASMEFLPANYECILCSTKCCSAMLYPKRTQSLPQDHGASQTTLCTNRRKYSVHNYLITGSQPRRANTSSLAAFLKQLHHQGTYRGVCTNNV